MDRAKLTDDLTTRLEGAGAADVVDVILELHAPCEPGPAGPALSRAEKIDLQKGAFGRAVAPVEAVIQDVGGEVTGVAWINQTLRARVPTDGIARLSELDAVAALDTPRVLRPEHG